MSDLKDNCHREILVRKRQKAAMRGQVRMSQGGAFLFWVQPVAAEHPTCCTLQLRGMVNHDIWLNGNS